MGNLCWLICYVVNLRIWQSCYKKSNPSADSQSWVTHVGSIGISKFIDIGQPVLFAVLVFGLSV